MKLLIVLCLVAVVVAAPPPVNSGNAQVLRYENENIGLGGFRYAFEQSDGTKHEQQGEIKNEGRENEYVAIRGTFQWIGPDGVKYTITYVADENGYQPEIDQGPGGAIPPDVAASLLG